MVGQEDEIEQIQWSASPTTDTEKKQPSVVQSYYNSISTYVSFFCQPDDVCERHHKHADPAEQVRRFSHQKRI